MSHPQKDVSSLVMENMGLRGQIGELQAETEYLRNRNIQLATQAQLYNTEMQKLQARIAELEQAQPALPLDEGKTE